MTHYVLRHNHAYDLALLEGVNVSMRRWLETLFNKQFFPEISVLENTTADRKTAKRWADWMREQWDKHKLSKLSQQRNLMTEVRTELKQRLGEDHWVLNIMNFTTDEWTIINETANQVVASRNEQQSLIENPQAIVDRAVELLNSHEWADIVAGLAVVSGRRCAELLKTAEFERASQYSVWFTGAVKRRKEAKSLRFEIPTLVAAEQVITALKTIRGCVDTRELTNLEINNRYSAAVARVCDLTYADLVPHRAGRDSLYTHLFRTIYARIATHWYAPPEVADIEYMAAIQGHYLILDKENPELRRSLASTRHYNDYKIGNGKGNIDGRQGIKIGEPGVTVLQAFRVRETDPIEEVDAMGDADGKRERSSIHIYRDEKERWQALFEGITGENQQQKMSALLATLEARMEGGRMGQTELSQLGLLAEQFVNALKLLKGAALIRCLCQREVMLLEIFHAGEYLTFYQDAIAKAIRAGELPLKDGVTAYRDSFIKEGVQYETRTHYALKFLADLEFDVGNVEPEPVAIEGTEPSFKAKADTTTEPALSKKKQTKTGRPKSAEAEARVQEVIDAIMAYNNAPGRTRDEMWAINGSSIKQLRSSNQSLIKRVILSNKDTLDEHHQKNGLGKRHNLAHNKTGISINDVIQF